MVNIVDILEGHLRELTDIITGKTNKLSKERLEICKQCPLYIPSAGGICDTSKFINPETGDVGRIDAEGYVRGCGCRLSAKTRVKTEECIIKKW